MINSRNYCRNLAAGIVTVFEEKLEEAGTFDIEVKLYKTLTGDFGLDSVDRVELAMGLEDAFGIRSDNPSDMYIETPLQAYRVIRKELSNNGR